MEMGEVRIRGRTDKDRVDGGIGQNVAIIAEGRDAQGSGNLLGCGRIDIGDGGQLRARYTAFQIIGIQPADAARADDSNSECFHSFLPFDFG